MGTATAPTKKIACGHCKKSHNNALEVKACATLHRKSVDSTSTAANVAQEGRALQAVLSKIEKPGVNLNDLAGAIIAGIKAGSYDDVLDQLDETLSDRLEGMGYSFVDETAPYRKAHAEAKATGQKPRTPKKPAKDTKVPTQSKWGNTLTDGSSITDYITSDDLIRRGDVVAFSGRGDNWDGVWMLVGRINAKTYGGQLLNGPNAGREARMAKGGCTKMVRKTIETAKIGKTKTPRPNVAAELESAPPPVVDDDETPDETPVPRRRKVQQVAPVAPAKPKAPAAGAIRRRVMRG